MKRLMLIAVFVLTLFSIKAELKAPSAANIRFDVSFPASVSLSQVKPGEYWVQALLHRYDTFKRADGHTVKLPMDRGEEFLKSTKNPNYGGLVDYEPRAEHCWNGDHTRPNALSRLRYHQFYAPKIVERITKSAPPGADLKSWRY